MRGENYLYFCDTTDEPNATDEAILIPASTVLGISPGAAAGTVDTDAFYLSFKGFVGDGNSRAAVLIACTAGKMVEAMDDVCKAMNSTGDGFVVIADVQNGVYCSEHITGCTVDSVI